MLRFAIALRYGAGFTLAFLALGWIADSALGHRQASMPIVAGAAIVAGPILGVVAYKTVEPVLLRRMLRRAAEEPEFVGAIALLSSVANVTAISASVESGDSGLKQRLDVADRAAKASERLIAVRTAESVKFRTGLDASIMIVEVSTETCRLGEVDGRAVLEVVHGDGTRLASFDVLNPWGVSLRRCTPARACHYWGPR